MKWADFFACWYKFKKIKKYFNNDWVGIAKNSPNLLDHVTLKSAVSHK